MLLMGFVTVGLMSAQTRRLEFDVATLKAEAPLQPGESYSANLGTIRNGKVTLTNVTLSDCIKFAYGLVSDAQVFGPDWIKSRDVRYEIVGQAPPDTPQDQILIMLQKLLAERLMLVLRHEQRELPFLALTVAKDGPRLAPAKEEGDAPRLGAGRIIHRRMPMSVLATLLSRFERQTVINLTGLNGSFAVNLQWTPEAIRSRVPDGGGPGLVNGEQFDPNGPSLYTAIQEQLGLRLESRRGPVDVLVVERAEKVPTEN
jgi:uncharacterized protein (TIGR03435 family)